MAELGQLLLGLTVGHVLHRPDGPGRHRVDADALRAELLGQALGEVVDGALGGGVVEEPRVGVVGLHRGGVHDRAARAHVLQRGAAEREHGHDVDLERLVDLLVGEIGQVIGDELLARVVHEDVQAAEALRRLVHEGGAVVGVHQVARQRDGGAPGRLDRRQDAVGVGLLLRQVGDGDVRALTGVGDGDRGTDAGVAAGDQGLAAGQPAHPPVRVQTDVRDGIRLHVQARLGLALLGDAELRVAGARVVVGQLGVLHGDRGGVVLLLWSGHGPDATRRAPEGDKGRGAASSAAWPTRRRRRSG